jgi:uracil-DNA glycosylase family 4
MTTWDQINAQIIQCTLCPRLVVYRNQISSIKRRAFQNQDYWGKPVPGFGDTNARVMVVGLAPGAHGSNRTGRMFTGDASGEFLYRALFKTGFANQPASINREDGLKLTDIFITAICRCAPPDNKPEGQEIKNCTPYLSTEISLLGNMQGIVVLGRIAFDGILKLYAKKGNPFPPFEFHHGAFFPGDSRHAWLLASYHPSRQNTQTGRLTETMFDGIWQKVVLTLDKGLETLS